MMRYAFLNFIILLLNFAVTFGQGKTSPGSNDSDINEFDVFWQKFRRAVVENDTVQIKSYTIFPFETRGLYDSDPVMKVNESDFTGVFSTFLNQKSAISTHKKTQMEIIREITKIEALQYGPYTIRKNWARVGDLEFKKVDGRWKLYFAFMKE